MAVASPASGVRNVARELARRVAPGLMADRARRYERDFRLRHGITAAAEKFVGERGATVDAGPFVGLSYPPGRLADVDTPLAKLSGLYESEIQEPFTTAIARGVKTFIDIGCADGYYAVGMPTAVPGLETYAYDLSASARELCREVSMLNGLQDRVHINRRFSMRSLDRIGVVGGLMLCDIEGAEVHLFSEDLVGRLAQTTVVIEVHEDTEPGAGAELQARFSGSHSVRVIEQRSTGDDGGLAEHRSPLLHWLVAEPAAVVS